MNEVELDIVLLAESIAFQLGDVVYHLASDDGIRGIVTGFMIRPGAVTIHVTWGNTRIETGHYASELTPERPL